MGTTVLQNGCIRMGWDGGGHNSQDNNLLSRQDSNNMLDDKNSHNWHNDKSILQTHKD